MITQSSDAGYPSFWMAVICLLKLSSGPLSAPRFLNSSRARWFKSIPKGFPKSGSVLSHDHYLTGSVISTNLLDIERVFPVGTLDLLTLQFEPLTTLGESDVIAN